MKNPGIDSEETTWSSTTSRYEIPSIGQLLLEDNFNFFNASLWKREIKMPLAPVSILRSFLISEILIDIYIVSSLFHLMYNFVKIIKLKIKINIIIYIILLKLGL